MALRLPWSSPAGPAQPPWPEADQCIASRRAAAAPQGNPEPTLAVDVDGLRLRDRPTHPLHPPDPASREPDLFRHVALPRPGAPDGGGPAADALRRLAGAGVSRLPRLPEPARQFAVPRGRRAARGQLSSARRGRAARVGRVRPPDRAPRG